MANISGPECKTEVGKYTETPEEFKEACPRDCFTKFLPTHLIS